MASNVELIIFDSCGSLSAALPAGAVAVGLLGGLAGILVTDELLAALAATLMTMTAFILAGC